MSASHDAALRLAILSTPRSGNTWLRHLLASMFDLKHVAVHRPGEIDWETLPPRSLVQIHWRRAEPLVGRLDRHGYRVVVLSRHPLDTLISVLSFANHSPDPRRLWTDFASEDGGQDHEASLVDLHPCSPEFLAYATGPRARALLSVSRQWWDAPGACTVRYEDLVDDTEGSLAALADAIGVAPTRPILEVIRQYSLEGLRKSHVGNAFHFWQGRPGLWRRLMPAPLARSIADAQPEPFEGFGYPCDPDPDLTEDQAAADWFRLQYETLRRERRTRSGPGADPKALHDLLGELATARAHLDDVLRRLYEERAGHEQTAAKLAATEAQLDRVHGLLYEARRAAGGPPAAASAPAPRGWIGRVRGRSRPAVRGD